MDIYFDAADPAAASELRGELMAFFARHATPGSDLDGAGLALSELLGNAVRHAPGPAWVHVDWSGRRPRVEVHDLGPGFDLASILADDPMATGERGLLVVSRMADKLATVAWGLLRNRGRRGEGRARQPGGPFGDVVRQAPGLCRMTSSVFGGIAARNTGGAAVVLEERIAVGDPECRVIVWLGSDKPGRWERAHDYRNSGG
jgi:anti-sigma regulatory factor (Ser/Thr protein kinase)